MTTAKWMPFTEFFALADIEGIDLAIAAEALLGPISAATDHIRVQSLQRRWSPPSEGDCKLAEAAQTERDRILYDIDDPESLSPIDETVLVERLRPLNKAIERARGFVEQLPRNPHMRPVPKTVWSRIERDIDPSCISKWNDAEIDAEEAPREWHEIDWISGRAEIAFYDWDLWATVMVEYHAMEIDRTKAKALLRKLVGVADQSRRGPKNGPRDGSTRAAAEKVAELKRNGDTRPLGAIAAQFCSALKDVTPEEFDNEKRRIKNGAQSILNRLP